MFDLFDDVTVTVPVACVEMDDHFQPVGGSRDLSPGEPLTCMDDLKDNTFVVEDSQGRFYRVPENRLKLRK
jgi:hypothetical protein